MYGKDPWDLALRQREAIVGMARKIEEMEQRLVKLEAIIRARLKEEADARELP